VKLPAWVHPPNETWSGPKGTPDEQRVICPEADCGSEMRLRFSEKTGRWFYGCKRWPNCDGIIPAKKDGTPDGRPSKKEDRSARQRAHSVFDRLWKGEDAQMSRGSAYEWMQNRLGLTPDEAHIAQFDEARSEELIAALLIDFDLEAE